MPSLTLQQSLILRKNEATVESKYSLVAQRNIQENQAIRQKNKE